jgi:hypothetical protein
MNRKLLVNIVRAFIVLFVCIVLCQNSYAKIFKKFYCHEYACDCTRLLEYKSKIINSGLNCDIINNVRSFHNIECFNTDKTKLYTYEVFSQGDWGERFEVVKLKSVMSNEDGLSSHMLSKKELCSDCDCVKIEFEKAEQYKKLIGTYKKLINARGFTCNNVKSTSKGTSGYSAEVICDDDPNVVYTIGPDIAFQKRQVTKTIHTVKPLNTLWQKN